MSAEEKAAFWSVTIGQLPLEGQGDRFGQVMAGLESTSSWVRRFLRLGTLFTFWGWFNKGKPKGQPPAFGIPLFSDNPLVVTQGGFHESYQGTSRLLLLVFRRLATA